MSPSLKIALLALSLFTTVASCDDGGDPWDDPDLVLSSLDGDDLEMGEEEETSPDLPPPICGFCDNCVLHARCLQPKLPFNLTTWGQKLAARNRFDPARPQRGCIAMIRSNPTWGHVAYVQRVWANGTITINEANFNGGCGLRRGRPRALNVVGYYCP